MAIDIEIQKLTKRDLGRFIELIQVFEDVFEMKNFEIPDETHLQNLLEDTAFFVFVGLYHGSVVGGLTAYILQQYYSSSPLVYIYDLAVRTELQRQGIGKMLMRETISYCKEKGFEEVFLQADKVDDYAIDFYRSIGGVESETINFSFMLKC